MCKNELRDMPRNCLDDLGVSLTRSREFQEFYSQLISHHYTQRERGRLNTSGILGNGLNSEMKPTVMGRVWGVPAIIPEIETGVRFGLCRGE